MSGEMGMGDGQFGSACITAVRQEGCQDVAVKTQTDQKSDHKTITFQKMCISFQ